MKRYCKYCKEEYELSGSHWITNKSSSCKDGIRYRCRKQLREYRTSDRYRAMRRNYNKSDIIRKSAVKWLTTENGRRYQANMAKKLNTRIRNNLRGRLRAALHGEYKSGSAIEDLGCSIQEFKLYIENQFQPGMTWENYGKWHLDHIIPLASFDLKKRSELLEACNYLNIQPLWALDNLAKGAAI